MMLKVIGFLLSLFLAGVVQSQEILPANSPTDSTVMIWRGEALKIAIPVRKDRVIKFDGAKRIQVGVPRNLQGIASAESIRGIVYLRSFKAFEQERFWFRDKDTQEIYVAEISARPDGVFTPIVIVKPASEISQDESTVLPATPITDSAAFENPAQPPLETAAEQPPVTESEVVGDRELHGKTVLARYAFQTLYAPDRLVSALNNVHPISVERGKRLRRMFVGRDITAQPLAQWKNGHQYLTAFLLSNRSEYDVDIDPRKIRGSEYWDASSFMTDRLAPKDSYGDSTAMVVISDKPYEEYEAWLR